MTFNNLLKLVVFHVASLMGEQLTLQVTTSFKSLRHHGAVSLISNQRVTMVIELVTTVIYILRYYKVHYIIT